MNPPILIGTAAEAGIPVATGTATIAGASAPITMAALCQISRVLGIPSMTGVGEKAS